MEKPSAKDNTKDEPRRENKIKINTEYDLINLLNNVEPYGYKGEKFKGNYWESITKGGK